MKRILLLLPFAVIVFGLFAQPNPTRATIKKTGDWTVTIYCKPTTTTTTSDINCSFSVSVLGTSGVGPSSAAPAVSLAGATLNTFPMEIKGGRRVYPYQLIVQSSNTLTGGQDNAIATVTFNPLPLGQRKIQLNDYSGTGSDWCYWYISHSGADQTPYLSGVNGMFYGTGFFNNFPSDSKVDINFPLPVKLLSFSAEKSGDKSALLNWSTASESNSSYFGVERSYDKITWKTAGQVKAAGSSQIVLNYNFLDKDVYDGKSSSQIVYYRLKMVDLDNSFEYSPIESVNFGKASDAIVNSHDFLVYPNPASEGIHVQWDAAQPDQPTSLEFYDVSGKLIYTEKVADQISEQYVDFTNTNIQTGLCLMRVMSGDKAIEYKQIVVGQNH